MTDEPDIFVARIRTPEGTQDVVTLLPSSVFFNQGLAPEAVVGMLARPLEPGERVTPDLFARNRVFVDFLHQFIAENAPQDPACRANAQRLGKGWIYIIDHRTETPAGDVPPEDILGALEVADGRVVVGSYRPSPRHRILSARGFFRLGTALHARLVEEVAKRNARFNDSEPQGAV